MDAFNNPWTAAPAITQDYREGITYDPNGNIVTYLRNGATAEQGTAMDNLTYQYPKYASGRLISNKLRYVQDQVAATAYSPEDIDTQTSLTAAEVVAERSDFLTTDNYQYDAIGNLTKDVKEGITNISWTVYGKIASITKEGNINLEYTYDATGNRIEKKYTKGTEVHYTWYVRDAQGNTMAVYEKKGTTAVRLTESHLYGSSRLGMVKELTKAPVITGQTH